MGRCPCPIQLMHGFAHGTAHAACARCSSPRLLDCQSNEADDLMPTFPGTKPAAIRQPETAGGIRHEGGHDVRHRPAGAPPRHCTVRAGPAGDTAQEIVRTYQ
jgi:hypothetical protein